MSVITISRQSGSEGNLITQLLCERLGYQYFDKKLMAELAQEIGLDADTIGDASVDEHQAKSFFERVFGYIQIPFGYPTNWAYTAALEIHERLSVDHISHLIHLAYQHGNVIIVGRGGQIVLADKPDVLHLRIVAPLETRINRWQVREGLTHKAAHDKVIERDRAHMDFVTRFFHHDLSDPTLYDLVINTEKITPVQAVDLITTALEALKTFA